MRTDSILHALKKEGHLDDFMLAMTEAPDGMRCDVGLAFCGKLGFKTSRTAVYENYRRHFLLWQLGFARSTAEETSKSSSFESEKKQLTAQRTFELLASPDLDPKILVALARLEVARVRAENDSRRVVVLEAQAAKAREIVSDKKLTPEELKAKLGEIYGVKVK